MAEGVSEGTNARPREIDRESCASRRTIFESIKSGDLGSRAKKRIESGLLDSDDRVWK